MLSQHAFLQDRNKILALVANQMDIYIILNDFVNDAGILSGSMLELGNNTENLTIQ